MSNHPQVIGMEINPKFVGALFTEQQQDVLRVFCFYLNGEIGMFDLPAKENLERLRHFFTKLNTEATCSSVVSDDVVQGRFYVRSEDRYWLYTLLASPGNVLPEHGADICKLPWKLYWRSQEADILEFGQAGEPVHCFATRTAISESDAVRLMKQSGAFINPSSPRKKRSLGRLGLALGIGLACLVIPVAAAYSYASRPGMQAVPAPTVMHQPKANPAMRATGGYYLLCNHQISGPFPAKTLADMQAAGQLAADALCRPTNSTEWVSLATALASQPPQ